MVQPDYTAPIEPATRSNPAPEAVIFDFVGVLTNPIADAVQAWLEQAGMTFEEMRQVMRDAARGRSESILFEWETGALSEAEVVSALEPVLEGRASLATLREAIYVDLQRNEPMIACMRRLHGRGMRLALLTNNVREAERDWRALVPEIDELVEVVVDSSRAGVRKPDPAIFELVLRGLGGIEPHRCLLVDDNVANVEAARALGMRALHYTDAASAIAELDGYAAEPSAASAPSS